MLTAYIQAAMQRASYEKLDDGTYYGEVPGLDGVWANGQMLEPCRAELQDALEDWILFRLTNAFAIPVLDGIDLATSKVA